MTTAADGAALDLAYTYDAVLNVDTLTETRPAGSFLHDYDYDEAHRLIERAQSPAGLGLPTSEGFAYDPAGNREDPSDPALYAYDANNRIQASPGGFTYAFDADGNIASRTDGATTEVYTYDKANRLRAWSDGTTTASYLYDPFGRRIKKTVGGTDTWYLWDGDRLLAEYDAAGARQVRYAYAGGFAPLQVAYADGQGGEDVYDVHTDHLDTPRLLTDDQQQVVWRASYEAFGTAAVDEDPDGDGTDVTFNVRFPGQYLDAESGLHYNRYRYYSPELGRYLNADPIGQLGSLNLFAYVSGRPTVAIDPDGLKLRWQSGSSEKFRRQVKEAVDYLNSGGVSGPLAELERAEETFYLEESDDVNFNRFDPYTNTIIWHPLGGFQPTTPPDAQGDQTDLCEGLQSPALGLLHEAAHALNYLRDRRAQEQRISTPDPDYGDLEERKVTEEIENPAARRLGEPTRNSIYGRGVPVSCPTCRTPAP